MKIIIGLGNPGKKYTDTRHNIGFEVLDFFANLNAVNITQKKFKALTGSFTYNDDIITLVKPQTFMNLSGASVRSIANYYKVSCESDILVVFDDIHLPFSKLRFRKNGSSGGHNGIKSIISHLGHKDFARIKIGVGNSEEMELTDYVLGKFTNEERTMIPAIKKNAAEQIFLWLDK